MRTRRSAWLSVAIGLLVATACGSTVVVDPGSAGNQQAGGELAGGDGLTVPDAGVTDGTGGITGPGSSGGLGGGSASTPGSGSGGFASLPPSAANARVGPGITPTTIYIGAPFVQDAGAANRALGADVDAGDTRNYYRPLIADLNKRGGILGRKVEALYYELRAASSEPLEQQRESACQHWTVDHKVFAILDIGPTINECARRAGAFVPSSGIATGPVYAKYPMLIDPAGMRFERLGQVTVEALAAQKWHVPDTRWPTSSIGLITWDTPEYHYAMEKGYHAAMRRAGLPITDTRYVTVPANVDSIAASGAAVSAAVLNFASQGILHVLILDGPAGVFAGTGLTFLFTQTAESQNYRPRYGFNSANSPGNTDLIPAAQQSGMLAMEHRDDETANDDGIPLNPTRVRCFKLLNAAGVPTSDALSANVASTTCTQVWFVETLLKQAVAPTLSGVIQAAEGLGRSFRPAMTYGSFLSRTQHDGAELVRVSRFDDACACMKYLTKPFKP